MQFDPSRPIYLQVMEEITKRAVRGDYRPGDRLPSVRDLAADLGVNPNTAARVYLELEREGFIETRRGQGSFLTGDPARIEAARDRLAGEAVRRFVEDVRDLGLTDGRRGQLLDRIRRMIVDTNTTTNGTVDI